jgi:uncharacterized membrane protein
MQMYLYGFALSNSEMLLATFSFVLLCGAVIGGVKVILHDPLDDLLPRGRSCEEDMLFRRFADGEIDDDEYRHHREALRGSPGGKTPCGTGAGKVEQASGRRP